MLLPCWLGTCARLGHYSPGITFSNRTQTCTIPQMQHSFVVCVFSANSTSNPAAPVWGDLVRAAYLYPLHA